MFLHCPKAKQQVSEIETEGEAHAEVTFTLDSDFLAVKGLISFSESLPRRNFWKLGFFIELSFWSFYE